MSEFLLEVMFKRMPRDEIIDRLIAEYEKTYNTDSAKYAAALSEIMDMTDTAFAAKGLKIMKNMALRPDAPEYVSKSRTAKQDLGELEKELSKYHHSLGQGHIVK